MSWRERLDGVWGPAKRWFDGHSERDRRIILGVVGLTVLSFLYIGIVDPLSARRERLAQEVEQGLERIERSERLVGALDDLQAERDDLRARLKVARRRLLPGGSGTLGAAALQERANDLANEHGVTVRTTQVLRTEPAEPYRKVAVRLTLSGALGPLSAMLAGLEYDHELTVPFMEFSGRGVRGRAAKAQKKLSATVEVAGYVASGDDAAEAEATDDLPGPPLPPDGGEGFIGPLAPGRPGAPGEAAA